MCVHGNHTSKYTFCFLNLISYWNERYRKTNIILTYSCNDPKQFTNTHAHSLTLPTLHSGWQHQINTYKCMHEAITFYITHNGRHPGGRKIILSRGATWVHGFHFKLRLINFVKENPLYL